MSNVCGRCRRPMSSHEDHSSCPQCQIAAGLCHVDVDNPCSICGEWTCKQWNKLRSLWWTPERGPVREGGRIGHQLSLTLKRGLFPNQRLQPPVQGLHQKSPLWSVEMI